MNSVTTFLGNIINRFLGSDYSSAIDGVKGDELGADKEWLEMIKILVKIIDQFMPVVLIGVGIVGAFFVIIQGVRYAKSENEEAKSEAKKKLINGGIGILIGLLIMIVLTVFLKNSEAVRDWLLETAGSK